ncbi:MAG: hypothetical protein AAGG44_14210 [Planctomycetota bacterium]
MKYWPALFILVVSGSSVAAQDQMPDPRDPYAAEAVRIPLREIWAYGMPGTWEISSTRNAYGQFITEDGLLVAGIRKAIIGREPRAGFVVSGTGMQALEKAHEALIANVSSKTSLRQGDDASVVFMARESQCYVHVVKVIRTVNSVDIYFQFVPHATMEVTAHFALIPLPDLRAGHYRVRAVQVPSADQLSREDPEGKELRKLVVSEDFTLSVSL